MAKTQEIFKRYEKKYLLTRTQANELQQMWKERMCADEYGRYPICNIYYDTEDFQLIRTSIEKPVYKEKLRLRSYGVPRQEDAVFLELKKKYKGIVYKRRASLKLEEAVRYLNEGEEPRQFGQILREIDWFCHLYHPVPKVFLSYDRVAYFGLEDPNLRITLDDNIRWRDTILDLSKGNWGSPVLAQDKILMEIKIPGSMPLWLSSALSELCIFPVSFSKYGTCYKQNLAQEIGRKGVEFCA